MVSTLFSMHSSRIKFMDANKLQSLTIQDYYSDHAYRYYHLMIAVDYSWQTTLTLTKSCDAKHVKVKAAAAQDLEICRGAGSVKRAKVSILVMKGPDYKRGGGLLLRYWRAQSNLFHYTLLQDFSENSLRPITTSIKLLFCSFSCIVRFKVLIQEIIYLCIFVYIILHLCTESWWTKN